MRKPLLFAAAALGILTIAGSAIADIPMFWLDKPQGRTNKNDPNSPLFVRTATPTAVGGPNTAQTQTAVAQLTANAAGTQTAVVVATQTAVAQATQTANVVATQTAVVAGTQTAVAQATQTANAAATLTAGGPTNTFTSGATDTFTYTNTATYTYTPTATYTPNVSDYIKFEDFESPLVGSYAPYTDGTSTLTMAADSTTFYAGAGSVKFVVDTSTGGAWGAGDGFGSNYALPTAGGTFDATGALKIQFYVLTDKNISFVVNLKEQNVVGTDPSNENWTSTTQLISASGSWQLVEIALTSFSENIYNPDCAPNCATGGDNTQNLDKFVAFDIQFNPLAATNGANVFVDDVYFVKLPVSTATPTYTYTPGPPTATPTDTFTPSASCGLPCTNCIKYEDFEMPLIGFYTYQDTGASVPTGMTTTAEYSTCGHSMVTDINTGTGNYAAVGFGSNFYVADTINATGAYYMHVWMKAGAAVSFKLSWTEYWGTPTDPNNEGWTSGTANYTTPGAWQDIVIPLSGFAENIYNGLCSPNCLTANNNTMDLDKVGAIDINFTQTGYNQTVYIDDVVFDTTAPTATPTPSSSGVDFTNYEDGLAQGSYTYTDGGCVISQAVTANAAYTGGYGWELTLDSTSGFVWGAGAGHGPLAPATTVDATGLNNLSFWVKVTGNITCNYAISIKESTGTAADNENWTSGTSTVADGAWHQVTLPLSGFTENIYNPDCTPNCPTTADNIMNKNLLANFDFNITNSGFAGTVYIDDIRFE